MATGQLAKTDALDARALAHCAEAVRPVPRPLPEAQAQELSALLGCRRQLIEMLTAEKNRLSAAPLACTHGSRPTSAGWSKTGATSTRQSGVVSAPVR
jgi:transposase